MILVTGATGNVGREVVAALAAAGQPVRALTRDPSKAQLPAGAGAVSGDLNDHRSLAAALAGVDAVFLLAGYPDTPGLLAAMRAAGVTRVVLLSSGAVVGGDVDNYVVRFNLVSEAAVRDSGVSWTALRPSGFMSNALRWLPQLQAGDTITEPFADVPITLIDPYDIAAVAALALTSDGHAGRSYRLTGPQALLPADEVEVLRGVLRRDLTFVAQTDDDAKRAMSENMPAQVVDAFFRFFRDGTYDDGQVDGTARQLLGRPLRTFTQWADGHKDAFS
jgi:uncharacterized protein YbjT (DUF2867 family)